ncbi:MAG: ABC transporter ATP-binding protein [Deltaproteobacteria bacterium]|nr:ABC transporter ATP-binding protein [Deltaproteobacteria bacterium]MBW2218786.1 ABC transporter ATP-binding protein [Deltaproteobacteria bacterium]
MPYAIETLNLSKRFPLPRRYRELLLHPFSHPETVALDNISVTVNHGEIFGVLGPNGSGKTTLIKILSTLVLPTTGKAFINNIDVTADEKNIKKIIGYVVSDERSFFWRLTGRQNLRFFCSLNNISAPKTDKKIEELVSLMGLEKEIDQVFQNYSSGNKQKIAIARGLLTDPQILFLDEPTKSLDPVVAYKLRRFIKDALVAESGKTVLIATNNMQEAEEICDRVTIIQNGKIRRSGTIGEIQRIFKEKEQYILTLKTPIEQILSVTHRPDFKYKTCTINPSPFRNEVVLMTVEINAEKESISDLIELLVGMRIKIESCECERQPLSQLFVKCINE